MHSTTLNMDIIITTAIILVGIIIIRKIIDYLYKTPEPHIMQAIKDADMERLIPLDAKRPLDK